MNKISTKIFVTIYSCLLLNSFFLRNSYAKDENAKNIIKQLQQSCLFSSDYKKLDLNSKIECLIEVSIKLHYTSKKEADALGSDGHKLLIKKAYDSIKDPKRLDAILTLLGQESFPLEFYKEMFHIYHRTTPLPPTEINLFEQIAMENIFRIDVYEIATPESYKEALKYLHASDAETSRSMEQDIKNSVDGADRKKIIPFLHELDAENKFAYNFVFELLVRAKDDGVIPLLIDISKTEEELMIEAMQLIGWEK